MFTVGQTVYRAVNPDDGGGYAPQHLTVLAVKQDSIVVSLITGGDSFEIEGDDIQSLYVDKLKCCKECWKLNGTGDALDQLYVRKGLYTDAEREAELQHQMEIWGATDYDDLLEALC